MDADADVDVDAAPTATATATATTATATAAAAAETTGEPTPTQAQPLTPAQKAEMRRQRILANSKTRMKFVSGEVASLEETTDRPAGAAATGEASAVGEQMRGDAETSAEPASNSNSNSATNESTAETATTTTTTTTEAPQDDRPKWEKRWERDVSTAQRRDISKELEENLKKTEELFSEAPRASKGQGTSEEDVDALLKRIEDETAAKSKKGGVSASLLVTLVVLSFGLLLGSLIPPFPLRPYEADAIPFRSAVAFAIIMQTLTRGSLAMLRVRQRAEEKPHWVIQGAMRFLPATAARRVNRITFLANAFKESVEDALAFGVGFGVSRSVTMLMEEV